MMRRLLAAIRKTIINRAFTSKVHYVIDNWLPPVLRDSRLFMLPLFRLAYKTKRVDQFMNFKARYFVMTRAELEDCYRRFESIATERETDLTPALLKLVLSAVDERSRTALDVACGKGLLAGKLASRGYQTVGVDVLEEVPLNGARYVKANIESLPFADSEFDTVISTHTLEHVIDIRAAVAEIKRVARRQIIVVVPCQRFFYYTLDLHLHFFPQKEMLINLLGITNHNVRKISGDWIYVGSLSK